MTSSGPDDAVGRRDEVSAAPQSDRALVSDGLGLLLLSTAPLRHAPSRAGGNFPNGGAAMLVADALRRHGASEGWLRDVGVGLKTVASVMIHHQSHDPFAAELLPTESLAWSRCASSVHLLGMVMAFDDERPPPGPHPGPRLPLDPEVAMGVARDLSSESVGRLISMLELAFVLVHRVPDGSSYSETSRHYARAAHLRLVASRMRRSLA